MDTASLMLDTGTWQKFISRKKQVFSKIKDGGKIGILPQNDPGAGEDLLLLWTVREGKVTVHNQPFRGFRESGADLLFVAEPSALERIYRELKNDPLAELKRQIRLGGVVFFVLKTGDELLDMGYEELIDEIGIPWIGTCH